MCVLCLSIALKLLISSARKLRRLFASSIVPATHRKARDSRRRCLYELVAALSRDVLRTSVRGDELLSPGHRILGRRFN